MQISRQVALQNKNIIYLHHLININIPGELPKKKHLYFAESVKTITSLILYGTMRCKDFIGIIHLDRFYSYESNESIFFTLYDIIQQLVKF